MKDPKIYLMKDPLLHADMLDSLNAGKATVVYSEDDGVMLKSGRDLYRISTESEDTLRRLCKMIENDRDYDIVTHQFRLISAIYEEKGLFDILPCRQAVYRGEKLPEPEIPGIEFRPLTMDQLSFVTENYDSDERYIRKRIDEGMLGAFDGEKCVGFIGRHGDGSVGLLKVLPAYRRRGIGEGLESRMVNRVLDEGRVPYDHVVIGNDASMSLQKKLGMEFAKNMVVWLWKKD